MKKIILIFNLFLSISVVYSQQYNQSLNLGQHAASFKAQATTGTINFPEDFYNKWKIIFFHPADFTPVCTSEIIALAEKQENFKKLNTALLVVSTDGINSHISWIKSIESIKREGKEPVKINFPLLSDVDLSISKKYNLLSNDTTIRKYMRAVVFIDPDNKIRALLTYPDYIGRNIDELERILIALQTSYKYDILTPANWKPGDDVLIQSPKSIEESDKFKSKNRPGYYNLEWFMWYRKL